MCAQLWTAAVCWCDSGDPRYWIAGCTKIPRKRGHVVQSLEDLLCVDLIGEGSHCRLQNNVSCQLVSACLCAMVCIATEAEQPPPWCGFEEMSCDLQQTKTGGSRGLQDRGNCSEIMLCFSLYVSWYSFSQHAPARCMSAIAI